MKTQFKTLTLILSIFSFISCKEEPKPPVISTTPITEISTTTAVSGGNVTDDGGASVISRGVCWNTSDNPVITNNKTTESGGSGSFTSNIINLSPNTTYYIRAYATNSTGTSYGSSVSFKTLGDKPASSAANASEILTTSAILNGTVNPNSLATTVTFEYGLTTAYGSTSAASQSPVSGDSNGNVTTALTGLTPGTTYHFRIKATNELGTTIGDDMTFTTLGRVPTVNAQSVSSLRINTATLNSSVNPNHLSTPVTFEWGTTTNYDNTITPIQSPLTGGNSINVSADLSGLNSETTYHFRIKATNELGTTYGEDFTFKTYAAIDADGNGYYSVTLGTQTWMKENLRTTKYNNGDPIGTTSPATKDLTTESNPKYQWAYNGDEANAAIYGRLYTWFAVTDSRKLCPAGWHVSTDLDWGNLEIWLINNGYKYDGSTNYEVYNKLGKSLAETTLWVQSDVEGSIGNTDYPAYRNKSGFSGLPAGVRSKNGWFATLGTGTVWWTSTEDEYQTEIAWARVMDNTHDYILKNGYLKVDLANSVRCIKD